MKKLINKILNKLGYIPKPEKPTFSMDVYAVYKEKISKLEAELEYYKKFAVEKNAQLPEMLMLAEVRIESLKKENHHLYKRLHEHNLLWNDDTMPYVLPYGEEFLDQLNQESIWTSSMSKKSKKSKKQEPKLMNSKNVSGN
jgi:hypothetical protein